MSAILLAAWLPKIVLGLIFIYMGVRLSSWLDYCRIVNRIAGPKGKVLLGNSWDLMVPREDIFSTLCRLFKQGSNGICRLWLGTNPWIGIYHSRPVEVLLSSQEHIEKGKPYKLLHPWLGTGLLTSTGTKWHRRRKMLTPSFHFAILNDFLLVINEQTHLLMKELELYSGSNKTVDLYSYINLATLDIICLTAMGKSVNALRNKDSAYMKALEVIGEVSMARSYYPWLQWDWLFRLLPIGRNYARSLKVLHAFTKQVIQDKKQLYELKLKSNDVTEKSEDAAFGQKRRRAFLDVLLEDAAVNRLTDADIQEEVDTFMFEGHDTTTSGIALIAYLFACHPEIQEKAQAEIDDIMGEEDRPFTNDDLASMKYLECCIKEGMRIYPPVPMTGRTLRKPLKIDDTTLPIDTTIVIMTYLLHRDPKVFPDPEKFDPSRFLSENCLGRNPYAYVPFSAGPRNCIGQKFAMMEVKTMICYLLRNFRITPVEKDRGKLKFYGEFVLRPVSGLPMMLEKRR